MHKKQVGVCGGMAISSHADQMQIADLLPPCNSTQHGYQAFTDNDKTAINDTPFPRYS
jgi:hypothetical protein